MHLSFDLLHETVDTAHAVTVGHVNAGSFTFVLAPSIHAVSAFPQTFVYLLTGLRRLNQNF